MNTSSDPPIFSEWYSEHHQQVFKALCFVAWNEDIARDATDEAFARAFAHWPRVASMHSPDGWVYRVAVNVVHRSARRRSREQQVLSQMRSRSSFDAQVSDLMGVIKQLPSRQRHAIFLRYLADLPEAEIARLMAISRGTVSSTLLAARRRLAVQLTS
jgi:RNA polymerase sigma-70 factor (ECF subfamily)